MPRQTQDSTRGRRSPPPTDSPLPESDSYQKPSRKRIREADLPSNRAPKRQRSPLTSSTRRDLPNPDPPSPPRSPPRKRPGASSRISAAARQAAEQKRLQREEEERKQVQQNRAVAPTDIVSAHYNAVPERGRDWRKTESKIQGLRSLNNWIKSCMIQKFSLSEDRDYRPIVLDMGCGKGGDLQKWQSAPQTPRLYVGVDPADVSIDQARGRYIEMQRRRRGPRNAKHLEAHFFAQDAFGVSLANIPIVREVGFDPHAGPDTTGAITARFSQGGFDVVSMMFCLHYSYESEETARGMLKNVAGALKKGGCFLGVMPNSDIIRRKIEQHMKGGVKPSEPTKEDSPPAGLNYDDDDAWDPEKPSGGATAGDDEWNPEQSLDPHVQNDEDDWDPEKPLDPPQAANGANDDDDWDPEKSLQPTANGTADNDDWNPEAPVDNAIAGEEKPQPLPKMSALPKEPLEWGNSIYKVKFPESQPLPFDGVFRPPFGWKYYYYLEEAVDVPEFVVPWEGFRALAEEYGLELMYRKPFPEVWEDEKDDYELGPLSERMRVKDREGRFLGTKEEMEAAGFYHAFCFYKI
ncbi:mRNA capping enzyme, large subunit, partial [Aureobasidium melanogenum]